MPDLSFKIEGAAAVPFAIAPTLAFKLRIMNADPAETIHTVVLRCQIQIDVTRRRYLPEEQARMRDLFGEPERWSQTLRSLLWTHVSVVVPAFQGSTPVLLPIHCTFDFNVGVTKYFEGLTNGEIPLLLMFSGTVFYADSEGLLQVTPIPWDQEARFSLALKVWREMMDAYYPKTAWLNLRRDVFERLYQYKTQRGIPTWEQALESVLPIEETVHS
ncbi:hypothetical protein H7849_13235 [Alloacidobacterium dinghuense]|uniref:Uncharacterized protein n=1 Tax=Alloacidobacterium dinghuense TaxID=2763107 RepID=A0A7G8BC89_9BACT|nr:DUF6084 family protein [Alloacidobacterium dinghuense]QNI30159.1 hypothetical protein H7849_13235 [Alloacidobacterium dinghuense]